MRVLGHIEMTYAPAVWRLAQRAAMGLCAWCWPQARAAHADAVAAAVQAGASQSMTGSNMIPHLEDFEEWISVHALA